MRVPNRRKRNAVGAYTKTVTGEGDALSTIQRWRFGGIETEKEPRCGSGVAERCVFSKRFTGWDEREKIRAGLGFRIVVVFAKVKPKLLPLIGKTSHSQMASSPYFSLAVLFVAALGFGLAPLGLAWVWQRVFSPAKPNAVKNAIYECGLESRGDAWVQFRSAYYLYAIIFLIFDVEAVFLLPFAVAFTGLGMAACLSMLAFVLLLIEGLAWAWVKGVLTWA
jgi:NADH:ubiquinone oxidoreductase subunit 3 (subunit A)